MGNTKQLSSFEKENINLIELKLDEADIIADLNETRLEQSEVFDKIKRALDE